MLDSLIPGVNALLTGPPNSGLLHMADMAANAAEEGMYSTKSMSGFAGRANYVSDDVLLGIPDPGAYAVYKAFFAAKEALMSLH
jgi:hypothetical protein